MLEELDCLSLAQDSLVVGKFPETTALKLIPASPILSRVDNIFYLV